MGYHIEKAAVIGSGTMGSGIAALLAGVGVQTLLLDIPAKDTSPGDPPHKRNAIVSNNIRTMQKSRPAQLFSEADLALISAGNIEDDLERLADVDWVIEVVVERLDIKQDLMKKLAAVVKPSAIISTNTSGLPIEQIAEHMDADFTRRFLGTHFFNPPRYLRLLEVIPHPNTDPDVIAFMMDFGAKVLGNIRIASGSKIGAGAIVIKDTTEGSTSVGTPARMIEKRPVAVAVIQETHGEVRNIYNDMVI